MLQVLSEGRADLDAPVVHQQLVNAEAALRDDARVITTHTFAPGELPADRLRIAVGRGTSPLHAAIADALAAELGPPMVVDAADDHEVYLSDPEVLAAALSDPAGHAGRSPSPLLRRCDAARSG